MDSILVNDQQVSIFYFEKTNRKSVVQQIYYRDIEEFQLTSIFFDEIVAKSYV